MSDEQEQAADALSSKPEQSDRHDSFYREAWGDLYMALEHLHGDEAHDHFHDGMLDAVKAAEVNGASSTQIANNIRKFKVEVCEKYAADKCRLEDELERDPDER